LRKSLQIGVCIGALTAGCFHKPSVPAAPPEAGLVIIGRTTARFIFPRESTTVFSWDIPTNDSYDGSPEHAWSANWEISEDRLGKDPDGVGTIVSYKKGRIRTGSLAELLAAAKTTVNTTCVTCGIPAYIPKPDPAVRAYAIDGRVVITISGSVAVQRLFPVIPDSVYLERYSPGGDRTGFWEVGVRRQ
jgi:hypothetical protein